VGEVARPLHREDEAIGDRGRPLPERLRRLHAVEGAVDLERVELRRRVAELVLPGEAGGIEIAAPRPVGPARDADADITDSLARHGSRDPSFGAERGPAAAVAFRPRRLTRPAQLPYIRGANWPSRAWRNGRRSGLKIRRPKGYVGSSPTARTIRRHH